MSVRESSEGKEKGESLFQGRRRLYSRSNQAGLLSSIIFPLSGRLFNPLTFHRVCSGAIGVQPSTLNREFSTRVQDFDRSDSFVGVRNRSILHKCISHVSIFIWFMKGHPRYIQHELLFSPPVPKAIL